MSSQRDGQDQLISFLILRRAIGFVGIALPVVLILGTFLVGNENCKMIQFALSDYYHTIVRDIFVAVLSILAIFLFSYKGPDKIDGLAANLAGIFSLGIAFFPTSIKTCNQWGGYENPALHNVSAGAFFLVLTYFSLFLFPKMDKDHPPTPEKLKRNKIYKASGWVMLLSIIIVGINMIFLDEIDPWQNYPITLIFEWVALWAFGISWIVKGEMFLEDKTH